MILDPDAQQVLDLIKAAGRPPFNTLTPDEARGFFNAGRTVMQPEPPDVAEARDMVAPGPNGEVRLRLYRGTGTQAGEVLPCLVYYHGGGWVLGDLDSHDQACRAIANAARCCVIAVDYRLAPEVKFPGAITDSAAATRWIIDQAGALVIDPARIAVGGDSAGGNLAAAVTLMARDRGGPAIGFQLLIYPVTDADFDRPSYQQNGEGYLLSRRGMQWFWDQYVPDRDQRHEPYAAPLRATHLGGLPPALVQTAGFDPLRDEGEAYAQALRNAGVRVQSTRYEGLIHGFFGMQDAIPAARPALVEAIAALREHLA
jgi:acetyl esterase